MTVNQGLQQAFAELEQGLARQARQRFTDLWHAGAANIQQRYVALKGLCRAMDACGEWHLSETVWEQGYRELEEAARKSRTQRFMWWMLGAGLFSFALLRKSK